MEQLPGHFSQILGDSAEEDFYALALAIGYGVLRRRNLSPGIDFIAEFRGTPFENSTVLRPHFSPAGPTAFSVKAGDASSADAQQLRSYVSQARDSQDSILRGLIGGVLVAGTLKTVEQINSMRAQGIHCWDIRRLMFYSVKAKKVATLSELGPVIEHPLTGNLRGGFIFGTPGVSPSQIDAVADAFVDDHTHAIQGDDITSILSTIETTAAMPIVRAMHRRVKVKLSVHTVGLVQRTVIEEEYEQYRRQASSSFLLAPSAELEVQSYATGPWTAIFRS